MKTLIPLLFLLSFPVTADLEREEFDKHARGDLEKTYQHCMSVAYDEARIDSLKARTESRGFIISRIQTRVMLYTACMTKVYDADLERIVNSLPTDGA